MPRAQGAVRGSFSCRAQVITTSGVIGCGSAAIGVESVGLDQVSDEHLRGAFTVDRSGLHYRMCARLVLPRVGVHFFGVLDSAGFQPRSCAGFLPSCVSYLLAFLPAVAPAVEINWAVASASGVRAWRAWMRSRMNIRRSFHGRSLRFTPWEGRPSSFAPCGSWHWAHLPKSRDGHAALPNSMPLSPLNCAVLRARTCGRSLRFHLAPVMPKRSLTRCLPAPFTAPDPAGHRAAR
jgi:hypothetical protein